MYRSTDPWIERQFSSGTKEWEPPTWCVATDGVEYGPLDRDTIQRWYYEGRLDKDSRVYESVIANFA